MIARDRDTAQRLPDAETASSQPWSRSNNAARCVCVCLVKSMRLEGRNYRLGGRSHPAGSNISCGCWRRCSVRGHHSGRAVDRGRPGILFNRDADRIAETDARLIKGSVAADSLFSFSLCLHHFHMATDIATQAMRKLCSRMYVPK